MTLGPLNQARTAVSDGIYGLLRTKIARVGILYSRWCNPYHYTLQLVFPVAHEDVFLRQHTL